MNPFAPSSLPRLVCLATVLALAAGTASAQCVADPVVMNLSDQGPGSLRQAVLDACADSTITFAVTGVVPLDTGEIVLTKGVSIQGRGAAALTIRNNAGAGSSNRIFRVIPMVTAVLSRLTISDGSLTDAGGGGIHSDGTLTLDRCVISGNTAAGNGGGISNSGSLTVIDSRIEANLATGNLAVGGGIHSLGPLEVRNSQIMRNEAWQAGGGLFVTSGQVTLSGSTIAFNTATPRSNSGRGGGLFISGAVSITNTTISDNAVNTYADDRGDGGGIWIARTGSMTLLNVTIARNRSQFFVTNRPPSPAGYGGGVYNENDFGGATTNVSARNTLIAGNSAQLARDFYGKFGSQGHNLIGVDTLTFISGDTTGNIVGTGQAPVNARLAPLGFYGGANPTVALAAGSPAINAANTAAAPQFDQRGAPRISAADIGAFELNNSQNGGSYRALLPGAPEGEIYDFLLILEEGFFRYSITTGALPFGLALVEPPPTQNTSRPVSIQGTVRQRGTFNLSITATDGTFTNVTDYTIVIVPQVDFYVDSAVGNDSGTGATGSPFKTVFRAIDSASAGSNIHIRAGNYSSDRPRITKNLKFYNWMGVGRASIGKQP